MGFGEQLKELDDKYPGVQWRLYNSMHYDCPVLEGRFPDEELCIHRFKEMYGDVPQPAVLERATMWIVRYLESAS